MSKGVRIKKQNCCMTFDEDLVNGIDLLRGRMPRSIYVSIILEKHLKENDMEV